MPPDDPSPEFSQALAARARLLKGELRTVSRLGRAYDAVERDVTRELDRVLAEIESAKRLGAPIGAGWIHKRTKLDQTLAFVEEKVNDFALLAAEVTKDRQEALIPQAIADADKMFRAFRTQGLRRYRLLSVRAFEGVAGNFADGSPIRAYFLRYGETAAQELEKILLSGVIQNKNARAIARQLKAVAGEPKWNAMATARTEPIRVYRQATIANYDANPGIVDGWIWLCAKDGRTCPVCLAMDGTLHRGPFASHIACRCTSVPNVIGAQVKLGQSGADWFDEQPESTQLEILGPSKLELYKNDQIELADLVKNTMSEHFGPGRTEKTLRELGIRLAG